MRRMACRAPFTPLLLAAALALAGCSKAPSPQPSVAAETPALVGAWRAKVRFVGGPLAEMKGLEFLYAYNAGGTMTESSNYDEAENSSPPAYGAWKQRDARTFETRYVFFTTQVPGPGDGSKGNRDWWPAGHGELTEVITLADDGQTYTSTITLSLFDRADAAIAGGGTGTGAGARIGVETPP
jgi:hypothetical protein